MSVSRRSFLAGLSGALAAPAFVGSARAETPMIVASLLGPDKPETLIWDYVGQLLEREMSGAFSLNIVPNAALGSEREIIEGLRHGSIQAGLATFAALSAWVPRTQIFDLPFLFANANHLRAALSSPVAYDLAQALGREGLWAPAFIDYGARHLLGQQVHAEPETMRNKRIRIIQSPLHARLWELFGALPIALPITDTYNALSTGHIDVMDLTLSAYAGFHLYDVAPEVTLTSHIHAAGAVLFSGGFYDRLEPEKQELLNWAGQEGARYFNGLMAEDERFSLALAEEKGAAFHPVANRVEWQETARPVWSEFAERMGGMEAIEALVALE